MKKIFIFLFLFFSFSSIYANEEPIQQPTYISLLPDSSVNYGTGYLPFVVHSQGNFYISEEFIKRFILYFFISFFAFLTFITLTFKAFNLGKK